MRSILRYLVILSLLIAALPLAVCAGSSNVTSATAVSSTSVAMAASSSGWVITPMPIAYIPTSISPFFACVFGVRIFPGADPVGAYSINENHDYAPDKMPGKVSGHMYIGAGSDIIPGVIFYLYDLNNGTSGSYYAKTDDQGYYQIDHVPFGNYSVFYCFDEADMHADNGVFISSVGLTESTPTAEVDGRWLILPV